MLLETGNNDTEAAQVDKEESVVMANTPEMEAILYEEKYHFTSKRMIFTLLSFGALFIVQAIFKNYEETMTDVQKFTVFAAFMGFVMLLTKWSLGQVMYINSIKVRDGYKYDANDLMFKTNKDVLTMAGVCMFAAILCGLTGIAGGMVLGPLFLSYDMLPIVVSATNQYITMIASVAVVI